MTGAMGSGSSARCAGCEAEPEGAAPGRRLKIGEALRTRGEESAAVHLTSSMMSSPAASSVEAAGSTASVFATGQSSLATGTGTMPGRDPGRGASVAMLSG